MPELPEVETIKNDLRSLVVGRWVDGVRVLDPGLVRYPTVEQFEAELDGQQFVSVGRKAKYLLICLTSGKYLVIQLMLTGQLLLLSPDAPYRKTTRLVLDLRDGQQLRLADSSRLARVNLLTEAELTERLPLAELGPEAVSDELTLDLFTRLVRGRRRQIKALLLDQRVISGIGNIYSDESLFAAGIHPLRNSASLSDEEVQRLYTAIRTIMPRAIELRGTTTRSYLDVLGRKGGYQNHLQVVARAGKPCPGCSGTVVRDWMAGRETYLCPDCQPLDVLEKKPARKVA